MTSRHAIDSRHALVNKVPEVTAWFWVIKVLCTTVGETAADFLNVDLGFGLTGTSIVTGALLAVVLVFQFRANRYVPGLYWSAVALVSVFGTLVTDNLTDNLGVALEVSTVVFGIVLGAVFVVWYRREGTLSIHSIVTPRREAFYWLAIFFTFALGTATGDLMSQALSLGYLVSALIVIGLVVVVAIAWRLGLHPVLAFWVIYIMTRPLGASLGDLLAQPLDQGGLGLGTTITSILFLAAILGIVVYLSVSGTDAMPEAAGAEDVTGPVGVAPVTGPGPRHGLLQTVAVVAVLLVAGGAGYGFRLAALRDTSTVATQASDAPGADTPGAPSQAVGVAPASPHGRLGDLSGFRTITQDTLDRLDRGDQSGATSRVGDLETAWDQAQGRLQARDKSAWTRIDSKIDTVLTDLRAGTPDPIAEQGALTALLAELR